ncbi:MAG: 16S rRNA (cytosine(1402)-N(4))-methyltransferase RsmH [Helicobacteraceae bacterium]|nr:16S rRNA (cytosine(1402)-N(4))-methyltransferase RsmH [Helicobacteraceae bacterium]
MSEVPHIPVLYKEVLEAYAKIDEGIIIDCTMGYSGHSSMLLDANPKLRLIGIDQDQTAIDFSTKRLAKYGDRVIIKKGRFSDVIKEILEEFNALEIKGILADIGVSSLQLDNRERGFSFESDTLDMRMNPTSDFSALNVVNEYDSLKLEKILKEYGELNNAKKLASFIVANRPFNSAKELSSKIDHLLFKGKKIHPSTLLFQAIRIEVNDELGELNSLLSTIENSELEDTVVGIISFHSLEDRIVKQRYVEWAKKCKCDDIAMRCTCDRDNDIGKILTKKPIVATNEEIKANPRSRSAKLRLFKLY